LGGTVVGRIGAKTLNARQVDTEKRIGYHSDAATSGLYLQVVSGTTGIRRSWIYRYTSPTTKTRREIGLGSTTARSLAEARNLAREYQAKVLDKIDPKDERDHANATLVAERAKQITFEQAMIECIKVKSLEWKNAKHIQQWTNTLTTYAFPTLGKQPVNTITTELIYKTLEPIWVEKTETATRIRQRIEIILDWCKARGYCTGDNPARLKGALGELLPKSQKIKNVTHFAALPFVQANSFLVELQKQNGVAPLALEFLMLTAARTNEVIGARWEEIDLNSKVWTIPAERMKMEKEHRVPISKRAFEILKAMDKAKLNEFVFPSHSVSKNSHLSNGAFLSVMKKLGTFSQYTPHGLRSTFRDWAAETTNFSNEVLELALAHTIKNRAEAAYRRQDQLEKRVKLMEQWAIYIQATVNNATVKPIGKKAVQYG